MNLRENLEDAVTKTARDSKHVKVCVCVNRGGWGMDGWEKREGVHLAIKARV